MRVAFNLEFSVIRRAAHRLVRRRYHFGAHVGSEFDATSPEAGDRPVSYRMPVGFMTASPNPLGHTEPDR